MIFNKILGLKNDQKSKSSSQIRKFDFNKQEKLKISYIFVCSIYIDYRQVHKLKIIHATSPTVPTLLIKFRIVLIKNSSKRFYCILFIRNFDCSFKFMYFPNFSIKILGNFINLATSLLLMLFCCYFFFHYAHFNNSRTLELYICYVEKKKLCVKYINITYILKLFAFVCVCVYATEQYNYCGCLSVYNNM